MKVETIKCDRCKCEGARSFKYSIDSEMDPSGNGYNSKWNFIDLCLNCMQEFVLEKKVRLTEISNNTPPSKRLLYG